MTIDLADSLTVTPTAPDLSTSYGRWFVIGAIIVCVIILIIAGFVVRAAVRKSNEARFGPRPARNPAERTTHGSLR